MFWMYTDNEGNFLKVNSLLFGKTKKINNAAYWTSKKQALSWETTIKRKYPNMELKQAELKLV